MTHAPHETADSVEPIAVIGMAARVPGAADTGQFWRNLVDGVESLTVYTREEQLALGVSEDKLDDPSWVSAAMVVDGIDEFDADLFGMTSREAELANPQHRLFLEASHTALEDAGYDPARFAGEIGVYSGTGADHYKWLNIFRNPKLWNSVVGTLAMSNGNLTDYVSTLVSYKLNLRGPSLTVQTACSTSLVAMHLAVESLRNAECDMALAGGVCVELPHGEGYPGMDGFMSPDGHCRPFDANADGTMWGSGVGVVVLKRLSDAIADGDNIRAVVLGNAINNDGSNKVGFTAPSSDGQAAAIAQAVGVAGVDPRTVTYVEAHGTGTSLGDPIEFAGLAAVYGAGATDRQWCGLGSVKSNIGHLSQAAGVIGVIKTVLALEHGLVPPTVNLDEPNPAIDLADSPFYLASSLSKWEANGTPRRAGVSSFGIGGTNAHVILEEAPQPDGLRLATRRPAHLLQVSARTPDALAAATERLAGHLEEHPDLDLADVAHTLRVGRAEHPHRATVVATDADDAVEALRSLTGGGAVADPAPRVAFLFSGQGAQYAGMGAELYASEPVFAAAVDECAAILEPSLGLDLRTLMFTPGEDALLKETRHTQPALFVLEYALATLWRSWGVSPVAMIGHSIGEYVAATMAGVFDLADALRLVATRGRLMQSMPAGAMLAVQLDESDVAPRLPAGVEVATVNGPGTCVVAGPSESVAAFADTLKAQGIGRKPLRTSHAFHSSMMEPILDEFADVVAAVTLHEPTIPFVSNVTGTWITAAEATDPRYWASHLRRPVRFGDGVAALLASGVSGSVLAMVECGPGRQLSGLVRMQTKGANGSATAQPSLPGPGERAGDLATLYAAAGQLWAGGVPIDATTFAVPGRRVPLPTYPYQRRRYWVDPDLGSPTVHAGYAAVTAERAGPLPLDEWFAVPTWRQSVRPLSAVSPTFDRCLAFVSAESASRIRVDVSGPRERQHGYETPEPASGAASGLVDGLRAAGVDVVEVRPGDAYRRDGGRFVVRPGRREDYDALLADLAIDGGVPARMLHAWTLDSPPGDVWAAQDVGFFSLLYLSQAIAAAPGEPTVHLDILTTGTQDVTGTDLTDPRHATVSGIARVVPLDIPAITVRHLDIDATAATARSVLAEILAEHTGPEPTVAVRAGRRWVPDHEQLTVPAVDGDPGLRDGGVYLVTGGLGGIGITVAEDLAERVGAKLVLLTRTGLPPRSEWDGPMEGRAARTVSAVRAIDAIRRIEAAGGEVLVCAADVADTGGLRAVRELVMERFGRLDGIVHAAGVPGGGMAEVKERADAERVLDPKLRGTVALHAVFGDLDLDFVVLCSSVTGVAGGFGQVDYCAANAYLDAYARSDHGWGCRVISVGWGAWLEVGMAAEGLRPRERQLVAEHQTPLTTYPQVAEPIDHPVLTELHPVPGGLPWCSGTVSPSTHWVLDEHRIAGVAVMPGTGHLETARAAIAAALPKPGPGHVVELSDVTFLQPLSVADGAQVRLEVHLSGAADGVDFEIRTPAGTHVTGSGTWIEPGAQPLHDLAGLRDRCADAVHETDPAAAASGGFLTFGPRWRSLRRVHVGDGGREQLGLLELSSGGDAGYVLHPALFDEATWPSRTDSSDEPDTGERAQYLPLGYGRLVVRGPLPARLWSHRRYRSTTGEVVVADIALLDETGREVVSITDFTLRRVDGAAVTTTVDTTAATAGGVGPAGVGSAARPTTPHERDTSLVQRAENQTDVAFMREKPGTTGSTGGTGGTGGAGRAGIRPRDGAEAMRRLLAVDLGPQVVVAATPLRRIIDGVRSLTQDTVEEKLDTSPTATTRAADDEPADDGPTTELERTLAGVWSIVLDVEHIRPSDDFFTLGGNSLVAVQLIAQVRKAVGVKLPMRSLFETSTLAGMAEQIERMRAAAPAKTESKAEVRAATTIPRLRRDA